MPFNDGISRINSFSLGDFHDFDRCTFKFLVFHHLEKKYELSTTTREIALGSLLDQAIKHFHKARLYGCSPAELEKAVRMGASFIRAKIANNQKESFYSGAGEFLDEELILQATRIFQDYYLALNQKIYPSVWEKDFCEFVIDNEYKLWGGPDTYEMAPDGVVEVADYKYQTDSEKAKKYLDMELMPKIYMLLASAELVKRGYKKARFVVRFWQDPAERGFYQDFELDKVLGTADFFKDKIDRILALQEITFCEKSWCPACSSEKREEFLKELKDRGFPNL